ncbi:hypothetical protein M419DRAFT_8587 [Trichoderma reesei RUT C-30]|uniref:Uncharacterized protein n=1 Tax=Hypocrea jecorina (strain ATCC 56765 / BCRC 32924 / NRRL 11460 / Rut C-30) TaxID=1344414 RepID=A0A024SAY5_HYPJR|nr:hypothetical protein M419DRAFT_8587 [Trichoderma reesei RUT C-30]
MSYSSTNAVYDGSNNGTSHSDASNGSTNPSDANPSDAIGRFLDDPEHPRPLGCSGSSQSAAEVEAAAKARILAKLHAFHQRFDSGNEQKAT